MLLENIGHYTKIHDQDIYMKNLAAFLVSFWARHTGGQQDAMGGKRSYTPVVGIMNRRRATMTSDPSQP